jgi:hypothetical protein
VEVCIGLDEVESPDWVSIYPNPSRGEISVEFSGKSASTLEILTSHGKLVKIIFLNNAIIQTLQLDLAAGVYH